MFSAKIYRSRRTALTKKINSGVLLFLGNGYSPMNYQGNPYHFRQDSSFLYYFGLDQPGLVATIDPEEGRTIIYGDELTLDDVVWTGPQPTIRSLAKKVGITEVKTKAELTKYLQAINPINRRVHYLPPYRATNKIKIHEWLNKPMGAIERDYSPALVRAVAEQRSVKKTEEIKELHEAVNLSAAMHLAAMRATRAGLYESDLVAVAQGETLKKNSHPAYGIILTVNGQTLHNHHHDQQLKKGQLILADMGAESSLHYAGDITRTFPVSRKFSKKQKEIYQIVLDAQLAVLDALKPGITYRSMHLLAAKVKVEGLKKLGLMKGDTDAAVKAGAHALFFPHGLGHLIGLDVHDMEDLGEDHVGYDETVKRSDQFGLAYLRLGKKLKKGYAITIEPGVYFIPELMDQWKKEGKFLDFINYKKVNEYRDFGGIRIEDNVIITAKGYQLLGDPIPKTIAEIEQVMKS